MREKVRISQVHEIIRLKNKHNMPTGPYLDRFGVDNVHELSYWQADEIIRNIPLGVVWRNPLNDPKNRANTLNIHNPDEQPPKPFNGMGHK